MISKLSLLAFAALPLASAMQIQQPENPASDGTITIKWTKEANDPDTFDFQLTNDIFHNTFAIANTVNSADGEKTLTLPTLPPGDGYTIIAHDVSNINNVIGQTGDFAVGASSASATSSTAAASGSNASSAKPSATTPFSSIATSAFGSTVKNTASSAGASASSAAAGAASSSAAPNAAPVKFNFSLGTAAVAVLSAVAGAAVVAL